MFRLLAYFLLIAGAATGLAWMADRPGSVTVEWLGYDVRTSVFVAVILLILCFAALSLAIWFGVLTLTLPKRLSRRIERHRVRVGQEAVRRGIFAAGAGDRLAAMKAGVIAKKNLPDEPLALLLEAQAAQLNEDAIGSRQAFERMLDRPDMTELGLRGLYIEAKRAGQMEAAKQFAERALAANPALAWSSAALFDFHCREGDWRAALRTLGVAKQNRHLSKLEANRRRALLLTQLAIELEDTQQGKALAYAIEAFDLVPALTPAAAVAGRILSSQGNTSRAAKLLTQAWKTVRHPEIALLLAHCRRGDSPRDRLGRVKALVASEPRSIDGDVAVAVAAIEAREWQTARSALEPYLANTPPARVCRLMARIEAGENRDAGRAREWLARAARGEPDPMWVAPDGAVSAEWRPLSPISGELGVFEWKTPPVTATDAEDILAEMSALDITPTQTASGAEVVPHDTAPAPGGMAPETSSDRTEQVATEAVSRENHVMLIEPKERDPLIRKPGLQNGEADDWDASEGEEQAAAQPPIILKPKLEKNKPTIFIPGPAPDDPGPRSADLEDVSTPLSRFRRPS